MKISLQTKKVYYKGNVNGAYLHIGDHSDEAKKIKQGYDFDIINGVIKILATKNRFDMDKFEKKLTDKTHTLDDIGEYILKELL